MGLKEAKHAVEELERSLGLPPAKTGCSGPVVTLVGLVVAALIFYRYFAA